MLHDNLLFNIKPFNIFKKFETNTNNLKKNDCFNAKIILATFLDHIYTCYWSTWVKTPKLISVGYFILLIHLPKQIKEIAQTMFFR